MADANGKPAKLLEKAPLAILICGDTSKAFEMAKDYWIIDDAIAGKNMILAAQDLEIGSVWLGTYPQMERVQAQKELFNLPEDQVPHSILAFGYPQEEKTKAEIYLIKRLFIIINGKNVRKNRDKDGIKINERCVMMLV